MSSKSTTGRYKNTHMTRGQKTLLLMTVPSILFIIVFSYLPISGWIYSFFDYGSVTNYRPVNLWDWIISDMYSETHIY